MKTQAENPNGLHLRYVVQKANGEPVDPRARYFVLRYDNNGDDPAHIAACRLALLAYANAIKPHLPQLSMELIDELFRLGREADHIAAIQFKPGARGLADA